MERFLPTPEYTPPGAHPEAIETLCIGPARSGACPKDSRCRRDGVAVFASSGHIQ